MANWIPFAVGAGAAALIKSRSGSAARGRRGRRADYTVDTALSVDARGHDSSAPGTYLVEFWDGTEIAVVPSYTEPVDQEEAVETALGVWEEYVAPNLEGAPAGWEPSEKDVTGVTKVGGRSARGRRAELSLWRYNRVTGYWNRMRDVTPATGKQWLAVWQEDAPRESFKVSARKPKGKPVGRSARGRRAKAPGKLWKRQSDGSYLWNRGPEGGGSYLIKREQVRSGPRRVMRWALYRNIPAHEIPWKHGWQTEGPHFRTLAEAKKFAEPSKGFGGVYGRSARGRSAKAPGKLWKRVEGVRIYSTSWPFEYIVVPDLMNEDNWYYTDDSEDAMSTARVMSQHGDHAGHYVGKK